MSKKVYMVRHQKAGILTSHVFAEPPTEAQVAPLKAECERLHGREGWVKIHEADLMDVDGVPAFPERAGGGTDSTSSTAPFGISAVGTVTNPGERETITGADVATVTADELLGK